MDIIPTPKKNIVLDATVLSAMMSCARLLDFRYNLRFLPLKGKSNSLEVGTLVHKVLEVYYREIIKGFSKQQALSAAFAAGHMYITGCPHCADPANDKPACGHQPLEYPGMQNTPEENDGQKRIGWKWALATCEQYFDHYKNDSWVSLATETVRGEVLYEDDEIRILWKAKFDWIVDTNQMIISVDHKTMKQRRDNLTLNNQFTGQCLVMKTRAVCINKIGFQTSLEPKEKFQRTMINYSADRLLEWQSEILPYYAYKYLQYAESGYWPPDYTHCENKYGKCAFADVCQADRSDRERVLNEGFFIGPKWDPTNIVEDEVE